MESNDMQAKEESKDKYAKEVLKDMYVKKDNVCKITPKVLANIHSSTKVKMHWKSPTILRLTGSTNAIKTAKRMINEELAGVSESITIKPCHLDMLNPGLLEVSGKKDGVARTRQLLYDMLNGQSAAMPIVPVHVCRITDNSLQEIYRVTGANCIWNGPASMCIIGNFQQFEQARQMILHEINKTKMRRIEAPRWVLVKCSGKLDEAKHYFPEINIYANHKDGYLSINGHPFEVDKVYRELKSEVDSYEECGFPVEKKLHGGLLSKYGKQIEELEQKHGVKFIIPPKDLSESNIFIRGRKALIEKMKVEVMNFVKQLEEGSMKTYKSQVQIAKKLQIPVYRMCRISDEFVKEVECTTGVQLSKQDDGFVITGNKEKCKQAEDMMKKEISALSSKSVVIEDWLKSYLGDALSKEKKNFPDIKVDEANADEIRLIGDQCEVEIFANRLYSEISEKKNKVTCVSVHVRKDFHRNIIGKKGQQVKRLKEQNQVDVIIPHNDSDECNVAVHGPKDGVKNAVDEIKKLVNSLEASWERKVKFSGNQLRNVKKIVNELAPRYSGVTYEFNRNPSVVTLKGNYDDVQSFASEAQEKLKVLSTCMKSVKIPMTKPQALAILVYKYQRTLKEMRKRFSEVDIAVQREPPTLIVNGLKNETTRAHIRIVKELKTYNTFCILEIDVDESKFSLIIGRKGQNIDTLRKCYSGVDINIPNKRDGDQRAQECVTLAGDKFMVDRLFSERMTAYHATKLRYRNYNENSGNQRRFGSNSSCYEDGYISSESSASEHTMQLKPVCSELDVGNEHLVAFVQSSEMLMKQLEDKFKADESFHFKGGAVTVAGKADDEVEFCNYITSNFVEFFNLFMYSEVCFHPKSSVDRTDIKETGLIVKWKNDTAFVYGMKNEVEKKLNEFDEIKKLTRPVSALIPCDKHLISFMRRSLESENQLKLSDDYRVTLGDSCVAISAEIPEVDSVTDWEDKCKDDLRSSLEYLSCEKLNLKPEYAGHMRRECKDQSDLVVEWIPDGNGLLVYGLKGSVDDEIKLLKKKLHMVMTKRKNVSYTWRCSSEGAFNLVRELEEHRNDLQVHLRELGSIIFENDFVTVHSDILEIESAIKWEAKCETELTKFFSRYHVSHVPVKDSMKNHCSSFAEDGTGVITKWMECEGCFYVIGIRSLVEAKEKTLRESLEEKKSMEVAANIVGQGDEEFETVSTKLVDAKVKYIERQKTKKIMLQNVKLVRRGDDMELSGKKKCVQLAKVFIDSIVTKEILIECFGAYRFLTGFATCRQIELLEFNHDCCVQVEELPGAEWGDRFFISLPENEKHWKKFVVTVEEGDITNEDVDMIVNTTNKSFSFDGPLSRCIFQKAGSIIKSQIVPLDNELRFSHGGRLKCRNILHVAIPSSSEYMDKLVLKILQYADTMGLSSITMPTIGAGQGGWKSTDVASAMLKAFKDFEATDVKSLKSIKVMVFTGVAFSEKQIFQQMLHHEKRNPPKTTKKEEVSGFINYISELFSRKRSAQPSAGPKPKPIPEVSKASVASESEAAGEDKPKKSQYAKLIVAASSDSSLSKAVNDLKNLTARYIRTDTLEPKTVLRLRDSDLDKIQKLAQKNEVRVVVNRKEDIHSISIQGIDDTHAFSRVKVEIEQILSDLATDLPKNWAAMSSSEKLKRDVLQSGSDEYRKIEKLFQDANLRKLHQAYSIQKTKKDEVSKRKNLSDVFERQLFHGTDSDTVDKICRNGFNRSYAGKNATMYGEGTYFSNQSSYSNSYAREYNGQKQMIVAEVLTGDYCKGVSSMKDAPKNPLTDELYDCVVDNTTSPSIFVVFRDWSAYPCYVITYSCR